MKIIPVRPVLCLYGKSIYKLNRSKQKQECFVFTRILVYKYVRYASKYCTINNNIPSMIRKCFHFVSSKMREKRNGAHEYALADLPGFNFSWGPTPQRVGWIVTGPSPARRPHIASVFVSGWARASPTLPGRDDSPGWLSPPGLPLSGVRHVGSTCPSASSNSSLSVLMLQRKL